MSLTSSLKGSSFGDLRSRRLSSSDAWKNKPTKQKSKLLLLLLVLLCAIPCHGRVSRAYRIISRGSDSRTGSGGSVEPNKRCRCAAVAGHSSNQWSRVGGAAPHCVRLGPPENRWCGMRQGDGNDRYEVEPAKRDHSL